jgi:hypothetical protein
MKIELRLSETEQDVSFPLSFESIERGVGERECEKKVEVKV